MNVFYECSPKELEILEFFAKSYEENPQELKEHLLALSLNEFARTMAFIQVRVPDLYKKIKTKKITEVLKIENSKNFQITTATAIYANLAYIEALEFVLDEGVEI